MQIRTLDMRYQVLICIVLFYLTSRIFSLRYFIKQYVDKITRTYICSTFSKNQPNLKQKKNNCKFLYIAIAYLQLHIKLYCLEIYKLYICWNNKRDNAYNLWKNYSKSLRSWWFWVVYHNILFFWKKSLKRNRCLRPYLSYYLLYLYNETLCDT